MLRILLKKQKQKNRLNCKNLVRLCQHIKNSSCFTSYSLKSLNFVQIVENFVQSCDFTSSAFRSYVSYYKVGSGIHTKKIRFWRHHLSKCHTNNYFSFSFFNIYTLGSNEGSNMFCRACMKDQLVNFKYFYIHKANLESLLKNMLFWKAWPIETLTKIIIFLD